MAENTNTQTQVKELTDRLETGMQDLFTSEKYMEYLRTMSKFHTYSSRNVLLIYLQKPDASKVASFRAWQDKFERHVKKGEKSIRIFAPTPFKKKQEMDKLDPDTGIPLLGKDGKVVTEEVEVTIPLFKPVPVFDVSQTDGKPLPNLAENLTGDVERYELFIEALRQISPLPIRFEKMNEEVDGVCRYGDAIVIREGMSEIQTVSAVIHEIGHAVLHDRNKQQELAAADTPEQETPTVKRKDNATVEVEAESVSYVVCQRYGIETGANSFGYLAHWSSSRDMTELRDSLDTIRKAAATLIDGIDGKLNELSKERGIDLSMKAESMQVAEAPTIENPVVAPTVAPKPELPPNQHIENIDGVDFVFTTIMPQPTPVIEPEPIPQKEYDLGYGHMGNGLTVWNRLEEADGDYVTVAHIDPDRSVTFYDKDMPDTVKAQIEKIAQTTEMTVSATQDTPVFRTPPVGKEPELPLPDPTIGIAERDAFGYTYEGILPLLDDRALELFDQDHTIYLLYEDNTEAMAFDREEIENHKGIYGIETEEWANIVDFELMKQATENSEATKEALLIFGKDDTFGIYQLRDGAETRNYRFERFDNLSERGLSVDRGNYELVYTAPLTPNDTLNSIYQRFNTDHPADFAGHSLSVSDIIVTQKDGNIESNYVDSFGFKVLSSFLGEEKTAPIVPQEQTTPTVAELETQVKAGQSISLTDLARAVHNEQKPSSSKAKPSILAQLKEGKKPLAQGKETQQTTPKRDNDREV